jgi:xanthine dehydrogenase molybdopterin-binding subunit B
MKINLSAAPYAFRMGVGYDDEGRDCDIEILSAAVLGLVDGMDPVLFKTWCHVNGVSYYARPKESFREGEALDQAARSRCQYLLMEDLS